MNTADSVIEASAAFPRGRLIIFDTTLRDPAQRAGAAVDKVVTLGIVRQLERLGVDVVDTGHPQAFEAMP